ncbi:MAG: hypothetical protein KF878_27770 [Planctomycetes bacterium]|nr:hypothetical protein [Planctomycetota bacterium]
MRELRQGRRDRRGAALVLVLIFAVAALTVVTTMLSLTSASAKAEAERHRDKTLHFVARYGLAMAVNEVNRNRTSGPYDPTGNGAGWILVGPDGQPGWPVFTSGDPADPDPTRRPRLLGRFKTMIKTPDPLDPQRKVLSVVAVERGFPASGSNVTDLQAREQIGSGRLRVVTAEVEFSRGRVTFDRNALSMRGPVTAGGTKGFYVNGGSANQVYIRGNQVPAVNISDLGAYTGFIDPTQISKWGAVTGLDPITNTAALTRPQTVTNNEVGLLNQETLTEIAQGIDARAAQIVASGTNLTATSGNVGNGTYWANNLNLTGSLTGSGTLVVNGPINVPNGTTLNWTGEIIVANAANAKVKVKGTMNVDGIMAIQGIGTNGASIGVHSESGGRINVGTAAKPGAFTILGDANTTSPLTFDSGSNGAYVQGIFSVMGNDLKLDFGPGGKIDIQGSMAMVAPSDATKGVEVMFRPGQHANLNYVEGNFDAAVTRLGQFFTVGDGNSPLTVLGYRELPTRHVPLFLMHANANDAPTKIYDMNNPQDLQ